MLDVCMWPTRSKKLSWQNYTARHIYIYSMHISIIFLFKVIRQNLIKPHVTSRLLVVFASPFKAQIPCAGMFRGGVYKCYIEVFGVNDDRFLWVCIAGLAVSKTFVFRMVCVCVVRCKTHQIFMILLMVFLSLRAFYFWLVVVVSLYFVVHACERGNGGEI